MIQLILERLQDDVKHVFFGFEYFKIILKLPTYMVVKFYR